MKILFRTKYRIPFYYLTLLLLTVLSSTYYYLRQEYTTRNPAPVTANSNLMALTGPMVVPSLGFLPKPSEPIRQEVPIKKNETFTQLMVTEGFDPEVVHQVYESARPYYDLRQIHAGRSMQLTSDARGELLQLRYSIDPLQTLIVSRNAAGELTSRVDRQTVETTVKELGGYIEGSLYSTINRLGEGDELVIHFADIFEWDVDFFKDLQAGDSFKIVYEKLTVGKNQPYGYGRILAAELVNKGKTYDAIGYQQDNSWEYYAPDGQPMKKAFLAAPLKFSRITSGFTTHRYHPILHIFRPHYGTDYAAPMGTPVRAIGKGRVLLAGWGGGAGKCVKLQHDQGIQTVYGHLARFAAGIRPGASVAQGQVIGYVGMTGLATGPHLDFRFLKNGKYVNFLKAKSPQAPPLGRGELEKFQAASEGIIHRIQSVRLTPAAGSPYISRGASLTEATY